MSNDRSPFVNGRFYPGDVETMTHEVRGYLAQAAPRAQAPTLLAMAPHAGWMFSGAVCGKTLGQANLADTVLLLGPKHSPLGQRLAVWDSGNWNLPGGAVPVDEGLATAIVQCDARLRADQLSHAEEHSLEVIVPFLTAINPGVRIVPVAIWNDDPHTLVEIGENIGRAIAAHSQSVSIVVSSDMSHMLPDEITRKLDALAIDAAVSLDPFALYSTVREHDISMCGVMPMTAGLAAAKVLGAARAELVAYATSGDITGDKSQVVGYAGLLVS